MVPITVAYPILRATMQGLEPAQREKQSLVLITWPIRLKAPEI